MRATPVSRTKLIAAVAATAFAILTATAQADTMAAGTWEGQITGGTLTLGDDSYHSTPITVPGGAKFSFTVPAGGGSVPFTAPATHIDIPVRSLVDGSTTYSAAGTIDLAPVTGTIDAATGAVTAATSAHGLVHLNTFTVLSPTSSVGSSYYCYFGDTAAPPSAPAVPAPVTVSLTGAGTLTSSSFAARVDCGDAFPPSFDLLAIVGHMAMPANTLTLTTTFTRRPDPQPTNQNTSNTTTTNTQTQSTTTTTTTKVTPVQCVVPKLKGLKLAKARKAATKAHCAVGKVKRKHSAKKATTVLKQGAKAGSVLAKGAKIALTVAK